MQAPVHSAVSPQSLRAPDIVLGEEIPGRGETDQCHCPAQEALVYFAAVVRGEVTSECGEGCHFEAETPFNPLCRDEGDGRNSDRNSRGEDLQRIHLMDVMNTADAEKSHHKESTTCGEVANINADYEHADQEQGVVAATATESLKPATQWKTEDKHERREQEQPREHLPEDMILRLEQE